jgi:hypothetical protein
LTLIVVWILVGFAVTTSTSFYRGTGSLDYGSEVPAVAEVGNCTRDGPVSDGRLGFWWECQVVIRVADGRVINVVLDGSKVTPRDAGRSVKFSESCSDSEKQDCRYGRPVGFIWNVVVRLVGMAHAVFTFVLLVLAVNHAVIGTVGPRRFFAVHSRLFRKNLKQA